MSNFTYTTVDEFATYPAPAALRVVQITPLGDSPATYASVWYLLSDGTVWSQRLRDGTWNKEAVPPTVRVSPAPGPAEATVEAVR